MCVERIPRAGCQIIHICQLTHVRIVNASRIEQVGSRSITDQGDMLAIQFCSVLEVDTAEFSRCQNRPNTLPQFVPTVVRWVIPALGHDVHQ